MLLQVSCHLMEFPKGNPGKRHGVPPQDNPAENWDNRWAKSAAVGVEVLAELA